MGFIRTIAALLFGSVFLLACDQSGPIKVGFIAGLSGPGADTGIASLNALKLATVQLNEEGGIGGRHVEIIARDAQKDPELAQQHVRDLHDAGVVAIVGPIISSVAIKMLPVINELELVTVSPTVSAIEFAGFRDFLFRMNITTRENARTYARNNLKHGQNRIAVALDDQNRIFTESWYRDFLLEIDAMDGRIVSKVWVNVDGTSMPDVAAQLLEKNPDAVVLLTNSGDSATLAKEIRKLSADVPLSIAEWAGSEKLIDMGGAAVEGAELVQAYDRYDPNPRYQKFVRDYTAMFNENPGYTSVLTYDAATVLFNAIKIKHPDQSLADAMVSQPPQQGLNQELEFDAFGDSNRSIYFVTIQDGKFIRTP
ncbi:ABC transporter substrate-binding protein [Thalassospira sp. MA62]|nr:ABC transporter substrate-binding protein [Thalassospira sp. MA62]